MDVEVAGRLTGKVAIVTGAGSVGQGVGNGRAMAVLFAREGARVALVDRVRASAAQTAALITEAGVQEARTMTLECDVTDQEQCRRTVDLVVQRWGTLDILVNNVGILGPRGSAVDVEPAEWERAFRVNVTSVMLMVKQAVPRMTAGGGGAVVNVSSVAGLAGAGEYLAYGATKAAVISMTRTMAQQHGPDGVRVNCLAPGLLYTPMTESMYARGMTAEQREARRMRSLLQVEGTAWDVARAALFLASDDAGWITGHVLTVDGGLTAGEALAPRRGPGARPQT